MDSINKYFLVAGGSRGVGAAIVKSLAKQGAKGLILSRQAPDQLVEGWQHQTQDMTKVLEFDLPEKIDGLVYAPGSIVLKPFHGLKKADFLEAYELNVLGAVALLQRCLPTLKEAKQASVLLFSTVAVRLGMPFHSAIASAKAGVEGLTRALAAEWAPKIRVNAIAPSLTETDLAQRLLNSDSKREAAESRHPLKRVIQKEEIAELARFLLSEHSASISGQVLPVDAGLSTIKTS